MTDENKKAQDILSVITNDYCNCELHNHDCGSCSLNFMYKSRIGETQLCCGVLSGIIHQWSEYNYKEVEEM